jgi:hypothetical protein
MILNEDVTILGYCAPIALMTQAASALETSVNFYHTARCNNPKDSHLHISRRQNLKSHMMINKWK